MLTQHTLDRLRQLGLSGMAEALRAQRGSADIQQLSFEERLGLLVDEEMAYRQDRRTERLLKEAHLRVAASLEDIDYRPDRGLDRDLMRTLGECRWVNEHLNVLVVGPTGAGKTWISSALGHAACRHGIAVRYYRVERLCEELVCAQADNTLTRALARLSRVGGLIIDDWGLAPLGPTEARLLLQVVDDRSDTRSTVIASQLPVDRWHDVVQDPTMADAILDRVVHGAYRITLRGESMRKIARQRRSS